MMYSGPEFNLIWGKIVKTATVPYNSFHGTAFSSDGSVVVAATERSYNIAIFRSTDGYLLDLRQLGVTGIDSYITSSRTILVSKTSNNIYVYFAALICTAVSPCIGFKILSY